MRFLREQGDFDALAAVFEALRGEQSACALPLAVQPGDGVQSGGAFVSASSLESMTEQVQALCDVIDDGSWMDDGLLVEEEELDRVFEVLEWLQAAASEGLDLCLVSSTTVQVPRQRGAARRMLVKKR